MKLSLSCISRTYSESTGRLYSVCVGWRDVYVSKRTGLCSVSASISVSNCSVWRKGTSRTNPRRIPVESNVKRLLDGSRRKAAGKSGNIRCNNGFPTK